MFDGISQRFLSATDALSRLSFSVAAGRDFGLLFNNSFSAIYASVLLGFLNPPIRNDMSTSTKSIDSPSSALLAPETKERRQPEYAISNCPGQPLSWPTVVIAAALQTEALITRCRYGSAFGEAGPTQGVSRSAVNTSGASLLPPNKPPVEYIQAADMPGDGWQHFPVSIQVDRGCEISFRFDALTRQIVDYRLTLARPLR